MGTVSELAWGRNSAIEPAVISDPDRSSAPAIADLDAQLCTRPPLTAET